MREWFSAEYELDNNNIGFTDPKLNALLKQAMNSVDKPKLEMPEPLSLYYTLQAWDMTIWGSFGYEHQPYIHQKEMNVCHSVEQWAQSNRNKKIINSVPQS